MSTLEQRLFGAHRFTYYGWLILGGIFIGGSLFFANVGAESKSPKVEQVAMFCAIWIPVLGIFCLNLTALLHNVGESIKKADQERKA